MKKIEIGKWELEPEIVVRTSMGSPTVYIRNWDGEHYSICGLDSEQVNTPYCIWLTKMFRCLV